MTLNTYRDMEIVTMRRQGKTYASIGNKFGLSRQRVEQIIKRDDKRELPPILITARDADVRDGFIYENLKQEICKQHKNIRNFCKVFNLNHTEINDIVNKERQIETETLVKIISSLEIYDKDYLFEKKIVKRLK